MNLVMDMKNAIEMSTPVAKLYLVSEEDKYLVGIYWCNLPDDFDGVKKSNPLLEKAEKQMDEYFDGQRRKFDLPYRLDRPPFYMEALEVVKNIEYGTTLSYRDVAQRTHSAKAIRAVGSANATNPLPILIPCHRVIASDGTIGGYGARKDIKRYLIRLEKASINR